MKTAINFAAYLKWISVAWSLAAWVQMAQSRLSAVAAVAGDIGGSSSENMRAYSIASCGMAVVEDTEKSMAQKSSVFSHLASENAGKNREEQPLPQGGQP